MNLCVLCGKNRGFNMTCSTAPIPEQRKMTNIFERYLTVWVALCIGGGILLGKLAPNLAKTLDGLAISVNGAPVVSTPVRSDDTPSPF